jgi:hypothetical protein
MVMMNTTGVMPVTGAGSSAVGCLSGGTTSLERVRYFPRQLLTADDFRQEQEYVRGKLRRHNRLLHGWGVVCGAEVKPLPNADWTVTIDPGYILGPQGDEILIDQVVTVDVSRRGLDGNAVTSWNAAEDPWCTTVRVNPDIPQCLYIAVAYAECPTRPVRVQPAGCSCDGSACEYSRIRDGFVVRVLTQDELPAFYSDMRPPVSPFLCPPTGVRGCPDCILEPWVVLAAVCLRDKQIVAADIDNSTYRRYAVTFADFWFTCARALPTPAPTVQPTIAPTRRPTATPVVTATAAPVGVVVGVRTGSIRLVRSDTAGTNVLAEVRASRGPIRLQSTTTGTAANAIEVQFGRAPVDFNSVKAGQTFIVQDESGAPVQGSLTVLPGNTVRWTGNIQPGRRYRVTLKGAGADRILSQQGQPFNALPEDDSAADDPNGSDLSFDVAP